MSLVGNVVWLIFGGLVAGLGYVLGGALLCLTIVGIPFGLQSIRLGVATFAPFGKEVRQAPGGGSVLRLVFDGIWLVLFGWGIALVHLVHALVLAVTIIGIPFAVQHLKLVPVALLPLNHELR